MSNSRAFQSVGAAPGVGMPADYHINMEHGQQLDPNDGVAQKDKGAGAVADELATLYDVANELIESGTVDELVEEMGQLGAVASRLGKAKHAARGALLTLATYKSLFPEQDIRYNKAEHVGGFSARRIDSEATVPFLDRNSLPKNVETHWLSQTLSFAGPWKRDVKLKTQPKAVGPDLIDAVNLIEELTAEDQADASFKIAQIVMVCLIQERNKGRVACAKPVGLTIGELIELLDGILGGTYKSGKPRLPQVMIYAIYSALMDSGVGRYSDSTLEPLGRMKAADRKSRTVGDIVIRRDGRASEAVETKSEVPITREIVATAIDKVKFEGVERYFILSTSGVMQNQEADIKKRIDDFRNSNGCEIIVNGVLDTIRYYLRLLPNVDKFMHTFVTMLENDIDLDYEHRIAWNELCNNRRSL